MRKAPFSFDNSQSMSRVKGSRDPYIGSAKLPPPPLMKSSSKKLGVKEKEDPFLAAYIECTKSGELPSARPKDGAKENKDCGIGIGRGIKLWRNMFSCKSSCEVREDGSVKMVHLPLYRQSARPVHNTIYHHRLPFPKYWKRNKVED